MKAPVVTVQDFQRDPVKFPYVSVASDLVLRGEKVPYGTRLYLGSISRYCVSTRRHGKPFPGRKKRNMSNLDMSL